MMTLQRDEYFARSAHDTLDLGKTFASALKPGDIVALAGNLGSGKTQFVIGICEGLHAHGHIASPTFTFIHEYNVAFGTLVHIDLYRINKRSEIDELGIEEYFRDDCICMIEWPELIADLLPSERYDVKIAYGEGENDRRIVIEKTA
ncbi:MAG: tRNA (adenosine(37)-N6)-threonylcarbamoyltransferase complex ATPase subunit type 1 TsaE [Ignavibacteriae bacterium]|nr:tRNA (adenosine(37)-N6)-threonylcarbamoyltransferase complex ATPase subunit type 1 TsaE [Ignavibacteriota bacterium]